MEIKYPVYQPSLTGNEKKYVLECLDSTWISSKGKFINQFEKSFADYIIKENTKDCFFIVSTRKEESKEIFNTLYKNDIHKEYALLIENVTGGVGKNIAKAKENKKKIII